jgi:branched-chain amino acid transport system ATP-binding protein
MARAYVSGQRLILVDEPSLGLAPLLVEAIFQFLERIRAESDVAVIVVDQFAERVLELAQTAYILRRGKIVYSGPAAELRGTDIFSHYVDGGASR